MKTLISTIALFLVTLGALFVIGGGEEATPPLPAGSGGVFQDTEEEFAVVTKVFDGDTVQLSNGRVVRYLGIDTPETAGPHTKEECFGKEATEKNRNLVFGKKVRLEEDTTNRDKYGRLLRYVYLDEQFVNAELVRGGYAELLLIPPDMQYAELLKENLQEARTNNAGLWSMCK